jgi:hypothetical protein
MVSGPCRRGLNCSRCFVAKDIALEWKLHHIRDDVMNNVCCCVDCLYQALWSRLAMISGPLFGYIACAGPQSRYVQWPCID